MSRPIEEFLVEVGRGVGEVDALVLQEALAEMRGHLEESAAGYVELGMDPVEAERFAVLTFGNESEARQVVKKKESILDNTVRPWGLLGWISACAMFLVSISEIVPESLSNVWLILVLGACCVVTVRGYVRKKIDWLRIPLVLAVGAMVGILLVAPQMRTSFGGGLDTVAQVERNRAYSEADFAVREAETARDFKIMRSVLDGSGADSVGSTKTADGYLLPRGATGGAFDKRVYDPDLVGAVAAWDKEARKFDLNRRIKFSARASAQFREEMAQAGNLNLGGNVWQLSKEKLPAAGFIFGLLLFWQLVGLFTRLVAETIEAWVGRNRGTTDGVRS